MAQIYTDDIIYYERPALGIEAASFASGESGDGKREMGNGSEVAFRASKDIAESPTAKPERPNQIEN